MNKRFAVLSLVRSAPVRIGGFLGGLSLPLFANAAIDVSAATTGISDAQTAVLAVLAATTPCPPPST